MLALVFAMLTSCLALGRGFSRLAGSLLTANAVLAVIAFSGSAF